MDSRFTLCAVMFALQVNMDSLNMFTDTHCLALQVLSEAQAAARGTLAYFNVQQGAHARHSRECSEQDKEYVDRNMKVRPVQGLLLPCIDLCTFSWSGAMHHMTASKRLPNACTQS